MGFEIITSGTNGTAEGTNGTTGGTDEVLIDPPLLPKKKQIGTKTR